MATKIYISYVDESFYEIGYSVEDYVNIYQPNFQICFHVSISTYGSLIHG